MPAASEECHGPLAVSMEHVSLHKEADMALRADLEDNTHTNLIVH